VTGTSPIAPVVTFAGPVGPLTRGVEKRLKSFRPSTVRIGSEDGTAGACVLA
jgi:hypothetical protein